MTSFEHEVIAVVWAAATAAALGSVLSYGPLGQVAGTVGFYAALRVWEGILGVIASSVRGGGSA